MIMEKRTMPVCFTPEQYEFIKRYAQKHGMLNAGQALERLIKS